jgi:hypothetical protein
MRPLDDWGQSYLRLGLRLEKHVAGYVDAYYGPEEIRSAIGEETAQPPPVLVDAAKELRQELPRQNYSPQRTTYLEKHLLAIETLARKLAGETFSYCEEVERYFDISPQWKDEAEFYAAHAELDEILPGEGALPERLQEHRDRFIIPEEKVLLLVEIAMAELRQRTRALFPLPVEESFEVSLVHEKPWGAYNWYMGQYRSLIELNQDLPTRAHTLLELFAHEAYPGHHTEAVMKERELYRGHGYAEQSMALLNTPENVVAEGIGNTGITILFEDRERIAWKNEHLYPQAGLEPDDEERAVRLRKALRKLRFVSANAALLLHEQGRPAEEVIDYIVRFSLRKRSEAEHSIRFLQSPLFRAYTFCYPVGESLIEAVLEQVDDRPAFFRRLLSEQWVPSGLAQLAQAQV